MEEDLHFSEYDLIGQIDWNDFFDEFPEVELPLAGDSTSPHGSPDSFSSWINHLENALLNDDQDKGVSFPLLPMIAAIVFWLTSSSTLMEEPL